MRTMCNFVASLLLLTTCGVRAIASAHRVVDPCVSDGPGLAQTLQYINGADHKGPQLFYEGGSLIQLDESTAASLTSTAPVLALDCHTYAWDYGDKSEFVMSCLNGDTCFAVEFEGWDGYKKREPYVAEVSQHLPTNPERADLYARALSHLIVLLQQDYKLRHSHPNDPFAKPQP